MFNERLETARGRDRGVALGGARATKILSADHALRIADYIKTSVKQLLTS